MTKTIQNKRWTLRDHPDGDFVAERDTQLEETTIDLDLVDFSCTLEKREANGGNKYVGTTNTEGGLSLLPDEVIVAVEALSVDAFVRTTLDKGAYHGSIQPGRDTIPALGYGTVLRAGPESKFQQGSRVMGLLGACQYAIVDSKQLNAFMSLPFIKPSASLGALGISGLTAYIGMFVAPPKGPKKGETVVVSAAAGGCGNIAAQMAKLSGARVVGIAGGPHKRKFLLEELGLNAAVDYKDTSTKSLSEQLQETCPDGIDFFFDNVGGSTLDAVLEHINMHSRIVICGAISNYSNGNINKKGAVHGPSNYVKLAEKSSSMTGFNMMHHSRSFVKALPYLIWHYARGNLKLHEHFEDGIENFPRALESLFSGSQCGRILVDVDGKQK